MQAHTKRIAILSVCSLLVAAVGLGLLVSEIVRGGAALSEHAAVLAEHAAKEEVRARLSREAQATTPQRESLADHFLASSDDSIDFLTDIEALAAAFGLSATTRGLAEGDGEGAPHIDVDFSFTGERAAVVGFAEALEYVPYAAELRSLDLVQLGGSGGWEGVATIRVSALSL